MKVSEITSEIILKFIREFKENLDETDLLILESIKQSSITFCCNYTGIAKDELDNYEDITIAVLVLISDMWDNRQMETDKQNVNPTIKSILDMHCKNLL